MPHPPKQDPKTKSNLDPCILLIRGQRVILDVDLARIYGVETKRLNEQVTRNRNRFPSDFITRLKQDEKNELVANCDRFRNLKHSSTLPRAFTEHGAIMVASVLSSDRAVEMSVYVIRAFVKFRSILANHEDFSHRLTELEGRITSHDASLQKIVNALRGLLQDTPNDAPRSIGFRTKDK